MKTVISSKFFRWRRSPLGTWVICPRQVSAGDLSIVSSSQILTMNEWMLEC